MPEQKPRLITAGVVLFIVGIFVLLGLYLARASANLASLKERNSRIAATLANITEKKLNTIGQILETESEGDEPDVQFVEVAAAKDICFQKESQLFIARLKSKGTFHFRFFNDSGTQVFDKSEESLRRHRNVMERLRQQLKEFPCVPPCEKEEIINAVLEMIRAERLEELDYLHSVRWDSPSRGQRSEDTESTIERRITIERSMSDLVFRRKVDNQGILHAKANIDYFFSDLSVPDVFDKVFIVDIVDDKRRIIFQDPDSSIRVRELDIERGAEPQERGMLVKAPWPIGSLHRQQIEIGGQRYVSFRQPLRLDFQQQQASESQEQASEALEWEIVALVRSDRLILEALRFPTTPLAYLVIVILVLICSLPLFEVWASSDRQRIYPIRHLWLGCSGLALATALLTLVTIDFGLKSRLDRDLRDSLKKTACGIEAALDNQVSNSLKQLKCLSDHYRNAGPLPNRGSAGNLFRKLSCNSKEWGADATAKASCRYPHLNRVFWVDGDGKQIAKWSVGKPTPLIDVQEREYFRRAEDDDLWSSGYFAEAIRSWNTGEQLVMFSRRYCATSSGAGTECDKSVASETECEDTPVAVVISTKLPSMLRPIVPPGRGFAVLDREGKVIFHSQPERNGIENFLAESEDAPELRGVLFSGAGRHFTSRYWGREHTMFARSLADVSREGASPVGFQREIRRWYIVVFQDQSVLQTVRLEAMQVASILLLLLFVLVVVVLVAVEWLGGRGTVRSLYPQPGDTASWAKIVAISGLMIAGLAVGIACSPSPDLLIFAGFLFPLTTLGWILSAKLAADHTQACPRWVVVGAGLVLTVLVIGVICVAWKTGEWWILVIVVQILVLVAAGAVAWRPSWAKSDASHAQSGQALPTQSGAARAIARFQRLSATTHFNLMGMVLLAALSALPAATFHQAASQERLKLEVSRGQLHLAQQYRERHRKIRQEYQELENQSLLNRAICDTRDIHYGGYFDTCLTPSKKADGESRLHNLFASRLFSKLYYVNPHSVKARALINANGWSWRKNDGRLVLEGRTGGPALTVTSRVPPPTVSSFGVACFIGAIWSIAVVGGLTFMGRKVFHTDFQPPARCLSELEKMRFAHLLVVVPPRTDTTATFRDADVSVDFGAAGTRAGEKALNDLRQRIDARFRAQHQRSAEAHCRNEKKDKLVRVDHLEALLSDRSLRAKGLRVFEAALAQSRHGIRIVIFSHGDPRAVLNAERRQLNEAAAGSREAQVLRRWREVLGRFTEKWAPDADDHERPEVFERLKAAVEETDLDPTQKNALVRECGWSRPLQALGHQILRSLKHEDVVEMVADRADDYYRDVWHALDIEERHLLAQMAEGSLVHPVPLRPLCRLVAWKLVERDPLPYRIASESFRRFVLDHYDPRALREWETEAPGLWAHVRGPLLAGLVLIVLVLFFTQQELLDVTLGLISAAAGSLLAVFRILDSLRKTRQNA